MNIGTPQAEAARRQRKALPAYACELIAKREQGFSPLRDLLIATDWDIGKGWRPWRIVVDPKDDPHEIDFAIVAGLSCLLVGYDKERMDSVAAAVSRWRPSRLVGVRLGGTVATIYIPASAAQECAG